MTSDQIAAVALVEWSQRALGKARQRQFIVAQQLGRVTVTLRFGEGYVFTVTRERLSEAASAALAGANKEDGVSGG